jgi:predicted RND superfamily exporter protein
VQAQFVIPMAISLSFGILFATIITLFLVPALYLLQQDLVLQLTKARDLLLGREDPPAGAATESATLRRT